ncbi:hypothetical protein OG978_42525 (plasmid) [Streptomyces sp. NBC_01591]|uniref:hypothetical protein n=1 Tax=Streptomyces sp. NBC_01591 TaxID=2975888 RepID=UPI002DD936DC|nr:hypothetical protein [Streptomyces sp. NBC_01591]WSD73863.1 hypothetical protein OG978_42525 [Streptomyces sp. NBC_01591]
MSAFPAWPGRAGARRRHQRCVGKDLLAQGRRARVLRELPRRTDHHAALRRGAVLLERPAQIRHRTGRLHAVAGAVQLVDRLGEDRRPPLGIPGQRPHAQGETAYVRALRVGHREPAQGELLSPVVLPEAQQGPRRIRAPGQERRPAHPQLSISRPISRKSASAACG